MRIITSSVIHRLDRRLYYLPNQKTPSKEYFIDQVESKSLKNFESKFGTYDKVGIYFFPNNLTTENSENGLIGIEFKNDDSLENIPSDFPFIILPRNSFITHDIAVDKQIDQNYINELLEFVKTQYNDETWFYKCVPNGLVVIFVDKDKVRILQEAKPKSMPQNILKLNAESFSKEELYKKAYFDVITGFYNWSWMWECLISFPINDIPEYAFVHFDVKDFNMLNELFNHQVANELLTKIANTIKKHNDWIYVGARCDNDNFALMIKDMPESQIREKLSCFFDEISTLDVDPNYHIYYRCGVVEMNHAMNMSNRVADCAKLAQSQGTGINITEINFYTSQMHENVLWGKQLKAYLDTAISSDEFLIYLQPKINVTNNSICGAEALIRWDYKHKGLLAPFKFIPHFELDDSIIKIDELVLRFVCSKLKQWKTQGKKLFPISVNLSRKHMEQHDLANHLEKIVDSYGVDHSLIEFELTETAAYDNQKYMISILRQLKSKGFMISMDDFGTGYSSFSLLEEMPLDTLKIDKSFVDSICCEKESKKTRIILHHIISMANEMGINCIAEGAEDYSQVTTLSFLGCTTIQGYFFSKPLPIKEFEEKYL